MKTVLIVSPHFPPVSAADMHRIRISITHFRRFGWNPVVLAVSPKFVECVNEPLLVKTVDNDVPVYRVAALPVVLTRRLGVGNLGLRSFPFLYVAGRRLIRKHSADLVYFSTTVFPVLALGRLWKREFGVPFVIDMQDPWVNDYHGTSGALQKSRKHRAALQMHRALEPWTMEHAGGLLAVSADYIDTLSSRYPALKDVPSAVLPFGGAVSDFEVLRNSPHSNQFFSHQDGIVHGVYVGRGGIDMKPALSIIFGAFRLGLESHPELFSRVRLHFIGTDYAPEGRSRKTVEPLAESVGLSEYVREHPARIPYFEGLQVLLDSSFLMVPGSEDPQYTASKIYPYILARKPMLAVFHERSSVCQILRSTNGGKVVAFDPQAPRESYVGELLRLWVDMLTRLPFQSTMNWQAFEPYSETESARRQCELFSQVVTNARK